MKAKIYSKNNQVILSIEGLLSNSEALKLRAHLESSFNRHGQPISLVVTHCGQLSLKEESFRAWQNLLGCLQHQYVNLVCFVFERENMPYRFFSNEVARGYGVTAIQRDSLEHLGNLEMEFLGV